jgi:hypothetical protein
MPDRIATVTMKNMETGEKFDVGEYFFFPTGFEMTTIVMVKDVETYGPHPDGSIQVDVKCKALDSSGMVFNLEANFIRHTPEEKAELLSDITTDSVHIFCGQYGIDDNGAIGLTNPEYRSVLLDFNEVEVRQAFKMNEEYSIKVALLFNERDSNVGGH